MTAQSKASSRAAGLLFCAVFCALPLLTGLAINLTLPGTSFFYCLLPWVFAALWLAGGFLCTGKRQFLLRLAVVHLPGAVLLLMELADLLPDLAAHVLALLLMALLFTLGRLARRAFAPRAE